MMNYGLFLAIFLLLSCGSFGQFNPITIIHDILQNNVAGIPLTHEKTEWDLHPDAGLKRRVQYEKDNGQRGSDLIERLGLGSEYSGP